MKHEGRCEYPNCGGECYGCVNGNPERRSGLKTRRAPPKEYADERTRRYTYRRYDDKEKVST